MNKGLGGNEVLHGQPMPISRCFHFISGILTNINTLGANKSLIGIVQINIFTMGIS